MGTIHCQKEEAERCEHKETGAELGQRCHILGFETAKVLAKIEPYSVNLNLKELVAKEKSLDRSVQDARTKMRFLRSSDKGRS